MYNRESFNGYFERQYSDAPPEGSAWYASLNIVIGLGRMIWEVNSRRDTDTAYPDYMDLVGNLSWKYFRNACGRFVDLMFKDYNLMAVQAICGMVSAW